MKILSYIHVLVFLGLSVFAQAQDLEKNLSLREALELADQGNWDVLRSMEYLEQSHGSLKESNTLFLPQVRFSETYTTTTDPLMVFGFKLKQEITEIADFDPESLNNPERIENFNTRIEVAQPLINLDGLWRRKAALAQTENSEESHRWTKSLVNLQTKTLYFKLQLISSEVSVLEKMHEASMENSQNALNLFEEGMVSKSDLLAAQLRTTEYESALLDLENQKFRINADLLHYLQLPSDLELIPTDSIDPQLMELLLPQISEVPETRADLKALNSQLEASEYELKSLQYAHLPRVNLVGSYEWNDQVFFGNNASNYMVGASLTWDLFQGGSRAGKMQQAKSSTRIADLNYREKLSQSNSELRHLRNQIQLTSKQLELADLAEEQSSESFTIISDRYAEGLEKTSDLLSAEAELLDKKLWKLKIQNQYQQLIFQYELLSDQSLIINNLN